MSQPGEKSFRELVKDPNIFTSFVSFKDVKVHRVTFDPNAIAREFKGGQYGDSWAVPVETAPGKIEFLRIKARGLRDELEKVKQRSLIEITQDGSGFQTTYKVKVISK